MSVTGEGRAHYGRLGRVGVVVDGEEASTDEECQMSQLGATPGVLHSIIEGDAVSDVVAEVDIDYF